LGAGRPDRDHHDAADLQLLQQGGGMWSMPQVTMILSNGAASSQP